MAQNEQESASENDDNSVATSLAWASIMLHSALPLTSAWEMLASSPILASPISAKLEPTVIRAVVLVRHIERLLTSC